MVNVILKNVSQVWTLFNISLRGFRSSAKRRCDTGWWTPDVPPKRLKPITLLRRVMARRTGSSFAPLWHTFFFWHFLNVLLTVHLGVSLHNDQLDAHFLYFTICQCNTTFLYVFRALHMLILRKFLPVLIQHLVSSSQPVHWTATDWEEDTRCCIITVKTSWGWAYVMLETCRGM